MDQQLHKRLDELEQHMVGVSETLSGLVETVSAINTGIQGNNEHDQLGYRHRIKNLEDEVVEIKEYKKKIQYAVGAITAMASFIVNAIWHLLSKPN
jgi:hypothetical protein